MKKNDLAEIKKLDIKSLSERAKKAREELMNLRLEKVAKKLTNLRAIKSKGKDLAQILTVLRQKQLLEELEDKQNAG